MSSVSTSSPTTPASAPGESTVATGRPASGYPAYGREFFQPRSAVWWVFCVLVAMGAPGVTLAVAQSFTAAKDSLLTIAPIFLITLVLFAVIVLWADPYRARRGWILAAATVYGATVPTWLGIHANGHLSAITAKLLPNGVGADWGAAVAGPNSEEFGKMLGVVMIMLIASHTLRRPMHGLLVGAFVGLGFQIFENVSYAANSAPSNANDDLSGAFSVTLLRSTIGISSHWLYSAIVGVGVAFLLGRTVKKLSLIQRIAGFVGFFALGWGLHFWWNSPSPQALAGILMIVKILVALTCFILVARLAWRQERVFLSRADGELRQSPQARGVAVDLADPAMTSAAGTRRERKKGLKEARKRGGRALKKSVKKARRVYLDALQAWGRRGTGVDELPTVS